MQQKVFFATNDDGMFPCFQKPWASVAVRKLKKKKKKANDEEKF